MLYLRPRCVQKSQRVEFISKHANFSCAPACWQAEQLFLLCITLSACVLVGVMPIYEHRNTQTNPQEAVMLLTVISILASFSTGIVFWMIQSLADRAA